MKKTTILTVSMLAFGMFGLTVSSSVASAGTVQASHCSTQVKKLNLENLISNGDFSLGFDYWNKVVFGSGASATIESDGQQNYVKLIKGSEEIGGSAISQDVKPQVGQKYQLSFDYQGDGEVAVFSQKGAQFENMLVAKLNNDSNQWTTYTNAVIFTKSSDWSSTVDFTTGDNPVSQQKLDIKNVVLTAIN